jgi:hypothetical protein
MSAKQKLFVLIVATALIVALPIMIVLGLIGPMYQYLQFLARETPALTPVPALASSVPTVDVKINGKDGPVNFVYGEPFALTWTSTNATFCQAHGDIWQAKEPVSGFAIWSAWRSTSFTLACVGPRGTASDSATVIVTPEIWISAPAMSVSRTVPGEKSVEFARFDFAAIDEVVIRGLTITRTGGNDADLENIALFDGETRLSSLKRLDDGKEYFGELNWSIPAYTVKTLTVKMDVSESAMAGQIRLGINGGKDIDTNANLDGLLFPVMGNTITVVK